MTIGERDRRALDDLVTFRDRARRLIARGRAAYDADEMLRYAAQLICINIGEAAARVSPELVAEHPEIRFQAMKAQRNLAALRYHVIDPEIIWNTLAREFPKDAEKIAKLV